jgi:hypothetical protein
MSDESKAAAMLHHLDDRIPLQGEKAPLPNFIRERATTVRAAA